MSIKYVMYAQFNIFTLHLIGNVLYYFHEIFTGII